MVDQKNIEVLHLTDLLEIQKGAVVSRTLVNQKTGTITLFAFDQNEGLSEHTAPFDASVHLIEGELEVTIAGTSYKLYADDLIIMPANQPHALQAITPVKLLLVMIRS
ncbi:MAG TPA: cupin domain-containing protein [Anaerolineaceae bacterium]|nr:cupin domain-containing protein [Anaerolineaceae bacterium]